MGIVPMWNKPKIYIFTCCFFILGNLSANRRFDFLNDSQISIERKYKKLQALSVFLLDKRKSSMIEPGELTSHEIKLLQTQFLKCDSVLVKLIYALIEKKMTNQQRIKILAQRLDAEKEFQVRDWLIEQLVVCIRSERMSRKQLSVSSVSVYDKIIDILQKSTPEYRAHYIKHNSEMLLREAIIGNNIIGIEQYASQLFKSARGSEELKVALDLFITIARQVPLSLNTENLLKEKLSKKECKLYRRQIQEILEQNAVNSRKRNKYPFLKIESLSNLNKVLKSVSNPLQMRQEALFSITAKQKWILFSGKNIDESIRTTLLSILSNKEDSLKLKNDILQRIISESKRLTKTEELEKHIHLICDIVDLLQKQNEDELEESFILSFTPELLKDKTIYRILRKKLDNDKAPTGVQCSIIFKFSQFGDKSPINVLSRVLNILSTSNALTSSNKDALRFSLQLAYKDKLKTTIDKLNDEDKKLLEQSLLVR